MGKKIYRIEMTYMCAGVITNEDGIIIRTAPILKWSFGKHINSVKKWCKNHKKFISFKEV